MLLSSELCPNINNHHKLLTKSSYKSEPKWAVISPVVLIQRHVVPSIRAGKASLVDSYCYFSGNELYVKNMHVADYWWASYNRHDPKRDRKLLLTKKELRKLQRAIKEKGLTIVTTRLFIAENGFAKLNIALARGKKEYDKRQSIKEKDQRREMERERY